MVLKGISSTQTKNYDLQKQSNSYIQTLFLMII